MGTTYVRSAELRPKNMMEPGPFQQSFYPDGEHQYLLPDDDGALLQTAAKTCLAVPIDVNALVAQNKGDLEFENEQLKFELDDSSALVVQSLKGKTLIDGKAAPKGRKLKLRAGSKIKIADEEFTVYRNTHAHA